VMTDSEDHAADEWRYACMSRPYVRTIEKPKPEYPSGYRPTAAGSPETGWRIKNRSRVAA